MNRTPRTLRILVTGATGLVGRALLHRLARDGHEVIAWVRDVEAARAVSGADVKLLHHDDARGLVDAMSQVDAVVNLAGRPIARRFTRRAWREIYDSRVGVTERLVQAMRRAARPPAVLVQASAIGIYGDTGEQAVDESTPPGRGMLAQLCRDWEQAALAAAELGVRVATMRIGLVLDRTGGVLAPLVPLFAAGLGATIGSGDQWVSFIHLHDLVQMLATAIVDDRFRGPIDAVAPHPVPQHVFAQAIGVAVGKPVRLRVPTWVLRLGLGRAAQIVTASQRVLPTRAQALGFTFCFPRVGGAVAHAVRQNAETVDIRRVARDEPRPEALPRRPAFVLEQHTRVEAPIEEVFAFFERAENLGAITPPNLDFRIRSRLPERMGEGARIRYRIALGALPMSWRTRIDAWDPPHRFVDTQTSGPYRMWVHEHVFRRDGNATQMIDRVWYSPPLGPFGRVANRFFVAPMLRRIFGFRRGVIDLRFGQPTPDPQPAAVA